MDESWKTRAQMEATERDVEVTRVTRGELRHLVDGEAAALQEQVGQLPLLQSPQHQARDETILMQEQPSAERGRQHGWRRVLERRFNLPAGCCAATRRIGTASCPARGSLFDSK